MDIILTPQELLVSEELRQSRYYSPAAKFREFDYLVEEFIKTIPDLNDVPRNRMLNLIEGKLTTALEIEGKQKEYEQSVSGGPQLNLLAKFWRPM